MKISLWKQRDLKDSCLEDRDVMVEVSPPATFTLKLLLGGENLQQPFQWAG